MLNVCALTTQMDKITFQFPPMIKMKASLLFAEANPCLYPWQMISLYKEERKEKNEGDSDFSGRSRSRSREPLTVTRATYTSFGLRFDFVYIQSNKSVKKKKENKPVAEMDAADQVSETRNIWSHT